MCLEKAGANVLDFEEFGSYQGEWLAFVEYKGEKGIVQGSYGSCSGCDAFEAEFMYEDKPEKGNGKFYKNGKTWDEDSECTEEEYNEALKVYEQRLIDFGKSYLESDGKPCLYGKEHYENRLSKLDLEDWFDNEEKEYIDWAINMPW